MQATSPSSSRVASNHQTEVEQPQQNYRPLTRCNFLVGVLAGTVLTIVHLVTTIFSTLAATACLCLNQKMKGIAIHQAEKLVKAFLMIPLSCIGLIVPKTANKLMGRTEEIASNRAADRRSSTPSTWGEDESKGVFRSHSPETQNA